MDLNSLRRVGTVTRFVDNEPRIIEEHFLDANMVRIYISYIDTEKGYK